MRHQTKLEKELEDAISINRMIVLLEEDGGFRQVILTKAAFKKVSDACIREIIGRDEEGNEQCLLKLNHELPLIPKEHFEFMDDYEEKDSKQKDV